MKHFKLLIVALALLGAGSMNALAESKTITLTYSSFGLSSSYTLKSATVDGYTFTIDEGYKGTQNGECIQMNKKKGNGILYNTTPISGLKSITVNVASGNNTYTITTGTVQKPTTTAGTGTSTSTTNVKNTGDTYFQIKVSGACYFSSIVITYEAGSQETSVSLEQKLFGVTSAESNPTSIATTEGEVTLSYTANTGYLLPDDIVVAIGQTTLSSNDGYTWDAASGELWIMPSDGFTDDVTVTIYGKLQSPTNLKASDITGTTAVLSWDASTSATGYIVSVEDENGASVFNETVSTTSVSVTGLAPETYHIWSVQAIDANTPNSDSGQETGEFTTPSACTPLDTPTGLSESNISSNSAVLSWASVANATGYRLTYGLVDNTGSQTVDVTATTYTLTDLEAQSAYIWAVRALGNGTTYCDSEDSQAEDFSTLAASCTEQYTLSYWQSTPQGADTKLCFEQVGNTSEYQIGGFTIPDVSTYSYWVGYNNSFYNSNLGSNNAKSASVSFANLPTAVLQSKGTYAPQTGAYGTLRIHSDYSDDNLYIGFLPAGYLLRYGTHGVSDWQTLRLTRDGNVYTSDIVTLTADILAKNICVNIYTQPTFSASDAGVGISYWSGEQGISTLPYKTSGADDGWETGKSLAEGTRGTFRTWADNNATNGYLHFVPYYRITYVNGESVTYSGDYSCEQSDTERTVTLPTPARDGYTFQGWSDGTTTYTGGTDYTLTADVTLTAQWERVKHTITWSTPAGTSTTSVASGDAVVLPSTEPASCDEAYPTFVGWFTTPAGENGIIATTKPDVQVTAETRPDGDATYYAVFSDAIGEDWTLVTDVSSLNAGDAVIIAAQDYAKAMSTTQKTNNRGAATITKSGSTLSYTADAGVQVFTLEEGTISGTWSFNTGSGYIYAAGSSNNNYLKTETKKSANSSWLIDITSSTYTIQAKGNSTHNLLLYNSSSSLFSCYSQSTTIQKAVVLYKQQSATGYISSCCKNPAEVSVIPAASSIAIDDSGEASTSVRCTQQGGNGGTWAYSVSPSTATFDGTTFKTKEAGTYTLTASYTEAGCAKSGSAIVTVTPRTYTLTFSDRGNLTDGGQYSAGTNIPQPTSPAGVCTDYIDYTFSGWAAAPVSDSTTTYTPVTFPYPMPAGDVTLYAVYQYTDADAVPQFVLTRDIPAAGDSVVIAAKSTSGAWYALKTSSGNTTAALAVTDDKVATPAAQAFLLETVKSNVGLKASGSNYVHFNSSDIKIADGPTNAAFTLTADNGMFYLTRADNQRWMSVKATSNGVSFGSTQTAVTAGNFYIFKKSQKQLLFTTTPICGTISTIAWQTDGIQLASDMDVSDAELHIESQEQTTIVSDLTAKRNADGTYTIPIPELNTLPCSRLRLTLRKDNRIIAQSEQRVPIIVSGNTTTSDATYFRKGLTVDSCIQCDIVVQEGVLLEHTSDSLLQFNRMDIYAGGRLLIGNSSLTLDEIRLHATNDRVSYAILDNNDGGGAAVSVSQVVHVKRIDGHYWYPFSLPYDCRIADIRQLNGQSLGTFGTDWGIKFYDGQRRQRDGNSTTPAGEVSKYWTMMAADATLEANHGYIIGLFGPNEDEMKSVYFTPATQSNYTESEDTKTTHIYNWSDNLTSAPRHHGWNFVGSPYISLFGSAEEDEGLNNTHSLRMGYINVHGETIGTDHVLVSIPDPGDANTYTQSPATSTTLKPFMAYFVQAIDPTDEGQTLDLTYSKSNRSLPEAAPRHTTSGKSNTNIYMELTVANGTLRDNAGIQVSPDYSTDYEIGFDLVKMYAATTKPQLFTYDAANSMMAYLAIPDASAQHIPLGLYVPSAGTYTLSVNSRSRLADAEAVYLLYEGAIVANLLYSDYEIPADTRGLVAGYSLDIRRASGITTDNPQTAPHAPHVTVHEGTLTIGNLPVGAEVHICDMLGRTLLHEGCTRYPVLSLPIPAAGVYTICITADNHSFTTKTIIR